MFNDLSYAGARHGSRIDKKLFKMNINLVKGISMQLSVSTDLVLISDNRTFILQKPILHDSSIRTYSLLGTDEITIVNFYLPRETSVFERLDMHRELIKELIGEEDLTDYTVWTNRCKSISLIRHLNASSIVYDRENDLHDVHPSHLREMDLYVDAPATDLREKINLISASRKRT